MLLDLPRPVHPPDAPGQRARDPIPREQQLLSLGQADVRIFGHRRQRQRLRRLPQRGHQHPRRLDPAATGVPATGTRITQAGLGIIAGRTGTIRAATTTTTAAGTSAPGSVADSTGGIRRASPGSAGAVSAATRGRADRGRVALRIGRTTID
ncbi:hypothetical protein [Microbispora sp. NPDC046933]|uniref:hypothetical protein n=1 Tax=Microbispora sp. NPDC046933 TaxID=3155618 RepID=UPI00340AFD32